jgi:hypothetical protein
MCDDNGLLSAVLKPGEGSDVHGIVPKFGSAPECSPPQA